MAYRTRTYIAADWDGDRDAVDQLHKWNDSNYWGLSFTDAHDLQQSRDSSLPCSIKSSLKERMDHSKRFVLIVGDSTDTVTKGSCRYCGSYNSWTSSCARLHSVDYRSYIKYECDKAVEAGIGSTGRNALRLLGLGETMSPWFIARMGNATGIIRQSKKRFSKGGGIRERQNNRLER